MVGFSTSRKIPANATSLPKMSSKTHRTHYTTNMNPLKRTNSITSNSFLHSTTNSTNSIDYVDGNPNLRHQQQSINYALATNRHYFALKYPDATEKNKTSSSDIISLFGSNPTQCNRFLRGDLPWLLFVVTEDATNKLKVFDCMQNRSSSRRKCICALLDSLHFREGI